MRPRRDERKEEERRKEEGGLWSGSGEGDGNTHLLGTVLKTLRKGGVGRRARLGAWAELDPVVRELAVEDAHVAVGFAAVAGQGHGEAVARPLRLDGLVVWHSGDGDRDRRVWKERIRLSDSELLRLLPLVDAGQPGEENWFLLSWASWRMLKGPLTTWILFSTPTSCSGAMECPAWIWCLQPGRAASPVTIMITSSY